MPLSLSRPLAFFDLETTGINISNDRIVEIAIIKLHPTGKKEEYHKRINPQIPIPIEISEIHGIYDIDVIDAPTFDDVADEIWSFIVDCDLAGYNSNKFDVPVMVEEFHRAGKQPDFESKNFVDVQNIFHKMEQRTLAAAYQFYCGKDLVNAHSAMADTLATLEILEAQIEKYDTLEGDVAYLSEFSTMGKKNVDFARRIGLDDNNEPVFNFGKHKGKPVKEIFKREPGYFNWIMNGDFALDTKEKFRKIKENL